MFLSLVVSLSLRLRRGERLTTHKIGGSRGVNAMLQCFELGLLCVGGLVVAGIVAAVLCWTAPDTLQLVG